MGAQQPRVKYLTKTHLTITAALIGCVAFLASAGWNKSVLKGGDQWGYNAYLVSIFITHDLKTFDRAYEAKSKQYGIVPNPPNTKNRIAEAPDASNGSRVLKYFYGVAALQLPFFLVTHLIVNGNGYTEPYALSLTISSIFYVLAGIILLLKLLKNFVSETTAAVGALLFFFGSNLFYFTVCNPGMSHPYLFFLFAALAFCTFRFYKNPSYKYAVLLGLTSGLIIVTRAVETIVLLVPILFGISGIVQLKERIRFVSFHLKKYLLALLVVMLVVLPQLLYWKYSGGRWIYDSYPNEGFDFLHPNIKDGLFSFKNGWFAYTPLMILPVLGLPFFIRKKNPFAAGITLYLLLQVYITYSWTQWNYNAGLGSRPMVQSYALLLIPFTVVFGFRTGRKMKWLIIASIAAAVYINLLRTLQMQTGNFIAEDATRQFNKQMLFKIKTNLADLYAFDLDEPQPDTTSIQFIRQLGKQQFENDTGNRKDSLFKFSGTTSAYFGQNEFNDDVTYTIDSSFHPGDYIRVSAYARVSSYENHYLMPRIVIDVLRNGEHIVWANTRIHNKLIDEKNSPSLFHGIVNQWAPMQFYFGNTGNILPGDQLKVYAWNPNQVEFWLDDLLVEQYRKR